MKGIHVEDIHRTCSTIYDFLRPMIDEADSLFWAINYNAEVDCGYINDHEEIYNSYLVDIKDQAKRVPPWSVLWDNGLKIFKPHMLKTFGRYFTGKPGDDPLYFGIKADTAFEACASLQEILGLEYQGLPQICLNKLAEHGAIFLSQVAGAYWRVFARDDILELYKKNNKLIKNPTNGNYTSWWGGTFKFVRR